MTASKAKTTLASVGVLALSACGGGGTSGGGSIASTPTTPTAPSMPSTPPSTGTNDDLLDPLVSETFANSAAFAGGTYPKDASAPSLTGGRENATISYNSTNQAYSLTIGSRTITFLPAHIDASQSNAYTTTYKIQNGATVDYLTLTKPGTSGRLTYRYVGGGYWQHTVDGASAVSGNIDAFAYGVPSAVAALRTTGRAQYDVDFVGAESVGTTVLGATGTGVAQIDLSTGVLTVTGTVGPSPSQQRNFYGSAKLASGVNALTGTFTYGVGFPVNGTMDGQFYGPGAEEIGLAYGGTDTSRTNAVVGTILGRGGAVANLPFNNAAVNTDSASLSATYNATTNSLGASAARTAPIVVSYDNTTQKYTLVNAERSLVAGADNSVPFAADTDLVATYPFSGYSSLKAFRWKETRKTGTMGNSANYLVTDFITGVRTADSAVPRTGTGGYALDVAGTWAENSLSDLGSLTGSGTMLVNYQTGAISATGRLSFNQSTGYGIGSLTGTGQLSSSANAFSGTISLAGASTYTGNWTGHFYGATAGEVGSSFLATNSSGGVISGLAAGRSDAALVPNYTKITDLTAATTFPYMTSTRTGGSLQNIQDVGVTFNPSTNTYDISSEYYSIYNIAHTTLAPEQLLSPESDSKFSVYKSSVNNQGGAVQLDVTARVLMNGVSNPAIALSYVSFVDMLYHSRTLDEITGVTSVASDTQMTAIFGMNTPAAQLPRSGTANYSGIAVGSALVENTSSPLKQYLLSGNSQLSFDFLEFTASGSMALIGTETVSGQSRDFGTIPFSGLITSNGGTGNATFEAGFNDASGMLQGGFFGPFGTEIGADFTYDARIGTTERIYASGGIVASKVP